jgi:predicted nucleotidyltransferase
MTTDIDTLRDLLTPIFKAKGVLKAVLFGSIARGQQSRKSDIDLRIVTNTGKRFFDRYDDFSEIYDLIGGKGLDLLIYTPEELQRISHRKFIQSLLEEGKTIYEH